MTNALTEFDVTLELWPWEIESSTMSRQLEGTNSPAEVEAPLDIARHPALAFLCNRLLTAFNGLRVCCPIGLKEG